MAKKTKSKRSKKPAERKRPTPDLATKTAAMEPAVQEASELNSGVDKVNIVLLVIAALILLFAGWIVWRSMESVRGLDAPSESTSNQSAIPLAGQANPKQLQSGSLPLQNQSTGTAQDNSAAALQPQQSLSPGELQKLQ